MMQRSNRQKHSQDGDLWLWDVLAGKQRRTSMGRTLSLDRSAIGGPPNWCASCAAPYGTPGTQLWKRHDSAKVQSEGVRR